MTHNEIITRDAARAVDKDVAGWVWDQNLGGLRLVVHCNHDKTFAPITDPGDAYWVEDKLHMNVRYKAQGDGAMTLQVSCPEHQGSIMHSVKKGDSTLPARMLAITQFAALTALITEHDDG